MSEESTRAPVGKIGRLPWELREQVNRRLNDGEPASLILPWLNGQARVRAILEAHFEGKPVNPQNLSAWRQGGFQDWLDERQEVEDTKALTRFVSDLVDASGGKLTDGAHALATGRLLARIQALGETASTEDLVAVARALATVSKSATAREKLALDERRTEQRDQELELAQDKFRRETCELFLKWDKDNEVRRILASDAPQAVKLEELHGRLFGEPPKPEPGEG